MNWLQDNPLGRVLVYVCGALLLLAVIMTVVWSLPVSVDTAGTEADESEGPEAVVVAREIDSLKELQVINERPLFNENRLPEIAEDDSDDVMEDTTIVVRNAPDVKLTGVIITPDMKIATLTPPGSGQESLMAHQGQALVGDYVGWKVGTVKARAVVLVSNDGQQLELELQVHDTPIKEPPKPVAVAAVPPAAAAAAGQDASAVGEDGQPLSRAEQIRQRIAERREELRVEQEARAAQPNNPEQSGSSDRPSRPRSAYQEAILNLMKKNNSEDNDSDSNNGG